ncbi:MAG: ABC transporter permease [Acidobacteriota bacterium]
MKRIVINLRIALRSLYSFKLRTSLAVLGVFLGTFSLIVVSNLAGSLARQGQMEIEKLGKNLLVVRSGSVVKVGPNTKLLSQAMNLTLEDARALTETSPFVAAVSPSSSKPFPIRYGGASLSSILVTGAPPNFQEVRSFYANEGRFISEEDDAKLERVAVLGRKVAEKLFGAESPIGKTILIYRVPCLVIGLMEEKGVDLSNVDQDNQVIVPLNTYLRRFVNQTNVNNIYVQVTQPEAMAQAKGQIEATLRVRHKITDPAKDDFAVIDLKDITALKNQAMSMITTLGRIAAAVSFTIGAIGILSIMILIVNERKTEIGIRRAVGSRKRDIVLQFLMESSFISFAGGTIGVIFGLGVSSAVFSLSSLPFSISAEGILSAFIASVLVGIAAGIYPSRRATTIQPVDIIRS